jgi:folate-binding protein YgfZ
MTWDELRQAAPRLSAAEQYGAAVERCAWVDLSDRAQIEVTGADRAAFLHNFSTQDVKRAPAGSGCEAFLANIKGRIVGHVLIFAGEQTHWLDGPPGSAARTLEHLERYIITDDVQLADRSGDWCEVGLIGPAAAPFVEALLPGAGTWAPFQHGHRGGVAVRRFSFTQQPGWLVGAAPERLTTLLHEWTAAGVVECHREVFEALRIEAGFPMYGVDLSEENLVHESGRTREAVSFTKGCYLGQESIARLESMGHTNRELRVLQLEGAAVPVHGAKVLDPSTGADWGVVTSAALSLRENRAVALALVRREAIAAGSVMVESSGGPVLGRIQQLRSRT